MRLFISNFFDVALIPLTPENICASRKEQDQSPTQKVRK